MKFTKKQASKPLRDLPEFLLWGIEAVTRPPMNR